MEWGKPLHFIWLWLAPAVLVFFALGSLRKRAQLKRFGDPALVDRMVSSLSRVGRWMKRLFLAIAVLLIVVALCQPHLRKKETLVERKGIDVVLAIDVSNSMLAKDVPPSRLEKAKLELAGLIDTLKGDRIGIVAFAGEAFIQCPLTFDRSAAKLFLSTVHPRLVSLQGTSLSSAIRTSVKAFGEGKGNRVVILLTDGEDHEGAAVEEAKKAGKAGVKLFTIGIGTPEGRPVPDESGAGLKKDRSGSVILSKLNESLLKDISKASGGSYFRSSRGDLEVDRIAGDLKRLEKSSLGSELQIEYEESFQFFLLLAVILLLAEMAVPERKGSFSWGGRRAAAFAMLAILPFACGFEFLAGSKNSKGNEYYKKGQVGRARAAYEDALKSDPDSPAIAYNLGNAYYKEEAYDKALAAYKKTAESGADDSIRAKAYYNLSNGYARQNRLDDAIVAVKQSLRLNPKDADAKFNLEVLTRRKKEEQKQDKQDKQDKEDQRDQQNQQNQQNQQGGGQGQQDQQKNQQDQEKQDQQNQSGQGQSDPKSGDNQDQKDQNQSGQGDQKEGKGEQKEDKQPGEGEPGKDGKEKEQNKKPEPGEGEQGSPEDKQDSQAEQKKDEAGSGEEKSSGGQGEEEKEEPRPEPRQGQSAGAEDKEPKDDSKTGQAPQPVEGGEAAGKPLTPAEMQALKLLSALEDQERQVLRMGNEKRPQAYSRRVNEKDW